MIKSLDFCIHASSGEAVPNSALSHQDSGGRLATVPDNINAAAVVKMRVFQANRVQLAPHFALTFYPNYLHSKFSYEVSQSDLGFAS
jgi:hypothetical protein